MSMNELMEMVKYIISGATITFSIFFSTLIISFPIGLIGALGKIKGNILVRKLLNIYTWVFRGSPLLLQIIFAYYGLGVMGIKFTPFQAALIAYSLNYGAYITEIIRGGINSVDKGQFEGFKVLGMTYFQGMRRVILPQAIRKALPSLCNEVINLIKDTAMVSVIGLGDILRNSKEIVTREFTIIPLIIAVGIYLCISSVIIHFMKKLEEKYAF